MPKITPFTDHGDRKPLAIDPAGEVRLPSFGVSLKLLQLVREVLRQAKASADITTAEVIEQYIKPWTESFDGSLADHMRTKYALDLHPQLQVSFHADYFSTASVFVCHAHAYSFHALVEALEDFEQEEEKYRGDGGGEGGRGRRGLFFWLDVFAARHTPPRAGEGGFGRGHSAAADAEADSDSGVPPIGALIKLLGDVGHTCLVAMPWSEPFALKRTWCLFELLATVLSGARLSVQLSKKRHKGFLDLLGDDHAEAVKVFSVQVDVEFSEARDEHTRRLLLEAFLTLENGYHHANGLITEALRRWLYLTAVQQVEKRMGKVKEARMAERVEKHKTLGWREMLCSSLGCSRQPLNMLIYNPHDAELRTFTEDCNLQLHMAAVQAELGAHGAAEALYRVALAGYEKHFGPDHATTLSILGNLALQCGAQGGVQEAERLCAQVLAAKERSLGAAHPSTLTTMKNLASLLQTSGRLEEATVLLRRALREQQHALGADHIDTLTSMEQLSELLLESGHFDEGKKLLQSLLTYKEARYGARHKESALTYEAVAALYFKEGLDAEAAQHFAQALEAKEALYGPQHPAAMSTALRLARVQRRRGENAEAAALFERVYKNSLEQLGARHRSCFELADRVVEACVADGQLIRAEALLQEQLRDREELYGPSAASVSAAQYYLGEVYALMGNYPTAETYHRTALGVRLRQLGPAHEDAAHSMRALAGCLAYGGGEQVDESKMLFEGALQTLDELHQKRREAEADSPNTHKGVFSPTHEHSEGATPGLSDSDPGVGGDEEDKRVQPLASLSPHLMEASCLAVADSLASICKVTGDLQQAEALLVRIRAHYRALHGPNDPRTVAIAKRITSVLQSLSN